MKVIIDESKCVGAGQCVLLAPEVFDQRDADGVVVLLDDNPPEELYDAVRQAVKMCPSGTITVSEDA